MEQFVRLAAGRVRLGIDAAVAAHVVYVVLTQATSWLVSAGWASPRD